MAGYFISMTRRLLNFAKNLMMIPRVSIVVPVYNGEKTLSSCLDSLLNQNYPKEQLEIIGVDNNSKDGSKDIIEKYPVKYFVEEKKGAAHAMNRGIQASLGSLIAFIDQDCVADTNWIKNMVNAFTSDDIGGCGGKILVYNPTKLVERYTQHNDIFSNKRSIQGKRTFFPFIVGCNAMYRRDIFQKAGLFDPSMFLEDADMSWRLFLMGYQIKYVPNALVYHKVRSNLISFFMWELKLYYNTPFLFRKYEKILKNLVSESYNEHYRKSCIDLFKIFCSLPKTLFTRKNKEIKFSSIADIVFELASLFGIFFGQIGLIFKGRAIVPISVKPFSDLKVGRHHVRIEKDSYLIKNNKIRWWHNGDGILIFNMENASYHRLNGIGSRIWDLLSTENAIADIRDTISVEYDINLSQLNLDFKEFLEELEREGLVSILSDKKGQEVNYGT